MPAARTYEDPCGTARALDVIGERWALLVVRELLFGPKRFGALRAGLHGISPNVLSQRLSDLEGAGVVRRELLDPPASVTVYRLTERGQALEPVLIELGRWGAREQMTTAAELSVDAFALALKTTFRPAFDASVALCLDGEWYAFTAEAGRCSIVRGRPDRPVTTLDGDVARVRAYLFGRESLDQAEERGLTVHGNRTIARRLPKLFEVPG